MRTLIFLGIFTIIMVGQGVLEYYICISRNKKLGLSLPVLNFIIAFVMVLNRGATFGRGTTFKIITDILLELLLYSIPAAILMVVYLVCREKQSKIAEIRKMNIQDL
ncbi:MAG: hypothetical protein ACYDG2_11175 [Ruminiclostridium sp.]